MATEKISTWEKIRLMLLPGLLAILAGYINNPSTRKTLRSVFVQTVAVAEIAQVAFADDEEFANDVAKAKQKLS